MNDNIFTWLTVGGAAILLVLGALWLGGRGNAVNVPTVAGASVGLTEQNYDWGNIPINGGNVTKEFTLTNQGSETLTLSNVSTSCMCTKARLIKGDQVSPEFGMHTKSAYTMAVEPEEKVIVQVIFDPAFHGPNSLGPITRQVVISTSDPSHSRLQFNLRGLVVK